MESITTQKKHSPYTYSYVVKIIIVSIVYIIFGKIGLYFVSVNSSAIIVWLPISVALASFLIFGYRIWPAILFGAFIVNTTTIGAMLISFFIAIGNTLEGFLGAYLINRFARGSDVFSRMHDFFRFVLLAVFLSTILGVTIGVTTLYLGGLVNWGGYKHIWTTWWLVDVTSVLIFTPAFLLWAKNRKIGLNLNKVVEFFILTVLNIIVGLIILQHSFYFSFLIIPTLIWLILRFNPRETATFIAFFSIITIFSVEYGVELIKNYNKSQSLIFIQIFVAVVSISVLPISILFAEQKKNSLELKKIASVFESIDKSIIGTTLNGTINYWNKSAEKLFGYVGSEIVGKNINILIPEDKRVEFAQIKKSIEKGIEIENLETSRIDKHRNRIDVSSTYSSILDAKGKVIGISVIEFSIIEQKKLEHATQQEYEKKAQELRKEFITNATHELRTPLAIIKGNIDIELKPRLKKANNLKTVNIIEGEIEHLAKIVQNLTIVSGNKNNPNNEKIGYREIILADMVKDIAEKYNNSNNKKSVSINFGNTDRSAILGEERSLSKLFKNIIDNSTAYSNDNVEINISIEKIKDQLRVSITDNGIGISKNDIKHIFDEFYRSDKSRTNEQGKVGLGLAVVKSIAEAHGGSVSARSTLGKGSTFVVSFPSIS